MKSLLKNHKISNEPACEKIHKKTTDHGTELGIRMDDSILTRGLYQGDVLYADDEKIIAVNTPPCEVIRISLTPGHEKQAAKVCYEIGNRHAPLFWGEDDTFITIYNEPMLIMLQKIHGVTATNVENQANGIGLAFRNLLTATKRYVKQNSSPVPAA